MTPTANQLQAINEPGNLLVMAAAGAGKTGTLVQRCLRLLLRPEDPVPVRRILVVTFTEAAAAEVRERIRQKLEEAAQKDPTDENLQEQLANIDSAYISTLHSFCFQLVRRYVLQLGLDPAVAVLEPHQTQMYFQNTLDTLLREHYEGASEFSADLKQLIRSHYNGWPQPVRSFVANLHEFTQTRPNPARWFARTLQDLDQPDCPQWREWYRDAVLSWCEYWVPFLRSLDSSNTNAQACADLLQEAFVAKDLTVPSGILARDDAQFWPKRKKGEHRTPISRLFDEAAFFDSLRPEGDGPHPLDEDWEWMRGPLRTMLKFALQFSERFQADKLERGVVDFHDLEQFALRLLINPETGAPTELAREWQQRFEAVFVDEYQDINAAQDLILSALSSPVAPGNRFLVGDIKQSIYRFRQADPSIFQQYMRRPGWQTIPLSENFRSHEAILNFVNPLFRWLLKPEFGGLEYDDDAALKVGNPAERVEMRSKAGDPPHVELHLFLTDQEPEREEGEDEPEIENAELEARRVAARLRELKQNGFTIYDQKQKQHRVVEWKDMVVLLRATKSRGETYAKAFAAFGVPLQTKRDAFFSTQEVLDLCNLLHIIDNPLQDIPLVAVLHSPLVGLNARELATIRIHSSASPFWRALNEVYERKVPAIPREKIERFLTRFYHWRNSRRCPSLAQRLESILADTGYETWLLAQPRGRERAANVQQLVRLARQFDETRGESLYLFLRHLEELQDSAGDIEPAGCAEENSVRLMTVHQSKGLEFPVVAIADLGKNFNFSDQTAGLTVHEQYGLCSTVKPPHTGQRYPSLPLWLARRAERFQNIGEEMRILYVALTRAQSYLLLFGSSTEKRSARWDDRARPIEFPQQLLQHRSWLDWLGTFVSLVQPGWMKQAGGHTELLSYRVDRSSPTPEQPAQTTEVPKLDLENLPVDPVYPHESATRQSAKTSVTVLRKKQEFEEETAYIGRRFNGENGTERGRATHVFLEHFSLAAAANSKLLRAEGGRLAQSGFLTPEQLDTIDFEAVAAFWNSVTGREFLERHKYLERELPFTFKANRADAKAAGLADVLSVGDDEFVVVQGVADLVLLDPKEIWLIDFKSDRIDSRESKMAAQRYKPQLFLYAQALGAIYHRPVTRKGIFFLALRRFEWFEMDTGARSPQLELNI